MTTDTWPLSRPMPFLLRFSEALPVQQPVRMKYDAVRQVSMVEIDEQWVDATSTRAPLATTRLTKVQAETTDDN